MDTVLPPPGLETTKLAGDGIGDIGDEPLGDRWRKMSIINDQSVKTWQ